MIGRSFRPSRRKPRENVRTWARQWSFPFDSHASRGFWNAVSRKKKCFVSRGTGVVPHRRHRGFFRLNGSIRFPQLSHWSPRAFGNAHTGHWPSTYRSGRNRVSLGQYGEVITASYTWPFSLSRRKISWTHFLWSGSAVFQYRSYFTPSCSMFFAWRAWNRSAIALGGTPSCSARTVVGVPCMSVPPTTRTSSPFIRW